MPDTPLQQLYMILDRLDYEADEAIRASLIDDAIGLADTDVACAHAWRDYR